MNHYNVDLVGEFVTIGTWKDLTVKELGEKIKKIVGFKGEIEFDAEKPDGLPGEIGFKNDIL